MDYEEAEKLVKGYTATYRGAISIREGIADKEEEIQHITYESFEKKETPRKIKSCKTMKPVKVTGNFAKRFKEQAENNYKIIQKEAQKPSCWVTVNRLNIDWYETVSKGKKKVPKRRNAEETIAFLEEINKKGGIKMTNKSQEIKKENNEEEKEMELNEEYLNELEQERLDGMAEMEESLKTYKEMLEEIEQERLDGLAEMIEHNARVDMEQNEE